MPKINYHDHLFRYADQVRGPSEGRSGPQLKVRTCPNCGNQRWKLWVNARTGAWTCYRCGEGGSYLRLFSLLRGVSVSDAAALLRDAPRPAAPSSQQRPEIDGLSLYDSDGNDDFIFPVPEECKPIDFSRMPTELKKRKLSRETIARAEIGYCVSGQYAYRLILPVVTGACFGFQARAFSPVAGDPKYMNPPMQKSRLVYGEQWLSSNTDIVFICEGVFDALKIISRGYHAVAVFGKTISDFQASLISSRAREVCLLFDGEPDARRAAMLAAKKMLCFASRVSVGWLPDDCDPCSASRKIFLRAVADRDAINQRRLVELTLGVGRFVDFSY